MALTPVEFLSNVWKNSRGAGIFAVLAFLAAVSSVGCGGVPKTYYYTLQVPAAPAPAATRTSYILGVERFHSPALLRDDRVMYFTSPTQVNFYEHHRWGGEPSTMVSEFTAQWLHSTGVFAQVQLLPTRARVDYTLAGTVRSFEEFDSDAGARARLTLMLSLVRASDHKVVWSGEGHRDIPVPEHGVDGVATALNTACAQVLTEMTPGIVAAVEEDF